MSKVNLNIIHDYTVLTDFREKKFGWLSSDGSLRVCYYNQREEIIKDIFQYDEEFHYIQKEMQKKNLYYKSFEGSADEWKTLETYYSAISNLNNYIYSTGWASLVIVDDVLHVIGNTRFKKKIQLYANELALLLGLGYKETFQYIFRDDTIPKVA